MKKTIFLLCMMLLCTAFSAEIKLNGGKLIPLDLKLVEAYTDDLNFCFATRYSDGSIHLDHSKGVHTVTERSCHEISFDNGKTWQKPPKDYFISGMNACENKLGERIRAGIWEKNIKNVHTLTINKFYADGKVETHSAEITLPYASSALAHRDLICTRSGRLIGTAYGMKENANKSHVFSYCSDDNGKTWRFLSTIAEPEFNDAEGANETTLVELADGTILAIYRVDGSKACRQKRSTDNGETWSKSELAVNFGASPHAILLQNGTLVLTTGRPNAHLFIDFTGTGKKYQRYCIWRNSTSSYSSVLEVEPDTIMVIYDESNFGGKVTDSPFSRIMAATFKVEKNDNVKQTSDDPRTAGFDIFYAFNEKSNVFGTVNYGGYSLHKSNSAHAYVHSIPERPYPVLRVQSHGTKNDGREWVRCDIPGLPIGVKKAEFEFDLRLNDNTSKKSQFMFSITMTPEDGKNLWAYVEFAKDGFSIPAPPPANRKKIPFNFGIGNFKTFVIKCDTDSNTYGLYLKGSQTPLFTNNFTPTKAANSISFGDGSGLIYGAVDLGGIGIKFIE